MPRNPPNLSPPPLTPKPPEPWTVHLKTLTPMFGGGAEARQVDPEHPIRAASVRGHLRFWWRATAGAQCSTLQELFDKESELWGNTETHGKVRVEVKVTDVGQECEPVRHVPRRDGRLGMDFGSYPAYALFPFQGTIKNGRTDEAPTKAYENVTFTLRLYCPANLRPQVETALHAWVMFGGIGARTRRGCGSLQLAEGEADKPKSPTRSPKLLTTLPAIYFVGNPQRDAVRAWMEAVTVYRDFRQAIDFARNPGQQPNRPGRSRYPEPDTLRRLTNRHARQHAPTHPVDGFPRADLGLPIIFHFKDERAGDPSDQTLQGAQEGKQRFASPVITKAAVIDGQTVPLVMVLDSPHVWEGGPIELKGQRNGVPTGQINLSAAELQKISPLSGHPIREALKRYVKSKGFSEVSL
jgi:CRISPR-associated protein Cmr1